MTGPGGGAGDGGWVDPLSRPVVAASISASGEDVKLRLSDTDREALAGALDLEAVPALTAEYRLVRRAGGVISVTGRIRGMVRPFCVISLEAFDLPIDEAVDVRFIEPESSSRRRAATEDMAASTDDPPDPVENGMIDLGRVTTEFLSLAIPAFPRKPGVESLPAEEEAPRENPFAALAARLGKPPGTPTEEG